VIGQDGHRLSRREIAIDAGIAVGLTALSLVAVASGAADLGQREVLSIALLVLESLPLLFRRRWPIPVFIVAGTATVFHVLLAGSAGVNEGIGSLVALFTVAERFDRRTSVAAAFALGLGFASTYLFHGVLPQNLGSMVGTLLVVGVAWALGDWARTRRFYAGVMEERARLLETEREERARRAVQAERDRIARELHDVVTHHVSVIVIQSGAGLSALDRRPEQTRTALEAIDRTARQALHDMRLMLGILGDGAGMSDPATDRTPMPGLERLGELIEEVRAAGLPVELSMEGERRPLDAGIELSAYRIVQEALTNILKHARGARARVSLRYDPAALVIDVRDQGGAGQRDVGGSDGGGHGIIGMRERVALFGGELEAGPTATGFRVVARLPVEPAPSTTPAPAAAP
jgi:signal transduction histidine kinase